MRKKLGLSGAVLAAAMVPAYWWLFVECPASASAFPLDLAEVRRLAASMPGEKATEVRVERITSFVFPATAVLAGSGWSDRTLMVYSYQLVFPDRTAIIDTAMDQQTAKEGGAKGAFDTAAYERMRDAMDQASFIAVTHEHSDHLGGLATHPNLGALLKTALLTREQLAHPDRPVSAPFPAGALSGYTPLEYEGARAIAPGVVLIKAPGHTPGSQLVYVQRADGVEYLLLGDVAWHQENLDEVRGRARLVTAFALREDREAVVSQLAALHALAEKEPTLAIVPGHDERVVSRLVKSALLVEGFRVRPVPAAALQQAPR